MLLCSSALFPRQIFLLPHHPSYSRMNFQTHKVQSEPVWHPWAGSVDKRAASTTLSQRDSPSHHAVRRAGSISYSNGLFSSSPQRSPRPRQRWLVVVTMKLDANQSELQGGNSIILPLQPTLRGQISCVAKAFGVRLGELVRMC